MRIDWQMKRHRNKLTTSNLSALWINWLIDYACLYSFFFFFVLVIVDSLPEPICSMKGDLLKHLLTFRQDAFSNEHWTHSRTPVIPLSVTHFKSLTFTKEKFNMINGTTTSTTTTIKESHIEWVDSLFFCSSSVYCIWFASTCIHIDDWATSIKCVFLHAVYIQNESTYT